MKVLTFGELMLRFTPEDGYRLLQTEKMRATFGGGEANVAVALANFGMDAAYLTCLPDNAIGKAAVKELRSFGVDTSKIIYRGNRIGIYYMEKGASQRPTQVIYDRENSAIATSDLSDYDWESIFRDINWLHITGITPALSMNMRKVTRDCLVEAKKRGITVSCDLNYRKKLWTPEQARETMTDYMQYVDVCIANEEDADKVLGVKADDTDVESGKLSMEGYKNVAAKLVERFGFKYVAISLRTSISADDNEWGGMIYDGKESYFSTRYRMHIVDRLGGGDCFAGSLIYALASDFAPQDAIEFAAAASCLKHSIYGDYSRATVSEVMDLIKGGGSGRVRR